MKYAGEGRSFYAVITPSCFLEFELPDDPQKYTRADAKKWAKLEDAAEINRAAIEPCSYRRG